MPFSNKKRLERWIRQQVMGSFEEELERFVIRHAPAGGKGTVVYDYSLKDKARIEDEHIEGIVEELWSTIESDVTGLGGTQRYVVEALREGRETPSGRFSARVAAEEDEENDQDGLDTEGPSAKGMISQQMRHNEAVMKTAMGGFGVMISTMQRMVANLAEQNEKLTEQRFKSLEVIEAALTQQHQRDMEAMVATAEQERKDELFKSLRGLAPVVVNKLAGKNLLPEKTSSDEALVDSILESMSYEQFQAVAHVMSPAQQASFIALYQSRQAKKAADEKKASPPNGS